MDRLKITHKAVYFNVSVHVRIMMMRIMMMMMMMMTMMMSDIVLA